MRSTTGRSSSLVYIRMVELYAQRETERSLHRTWTSDQNLSGKSLNWVIGWARCLLVPSALLVRNDLCPGGTFNHKLLFKVAMPQRVTQLPTIAGNTVSRTAKTA